MALLSVNAPGIFGMLTAAFECKTQFLKTLEVLSQDQTEAGIKIKHDLLELFAPVNALILKINQKLGIDPFKEPDPPKT